MKYLYEFIGTFFLVLTVGMTVLTPNSLANFAPIAIGSVLAVMVYAGGHISGAHYNPAVSLAVFLRGKLPCKDLIAYWIAQFLAGAAAAYLVIYLKDFTPQNALNLNLIKIFIVELLFTFALCYVVLNVATAKATEGNSYFGFAIGFTVLVGAYAVGALSGGAFNPSVVLGIVLMKLLTWSQVWVYLLANFAGAGLAALVFKGAHPGECCCCNKAGCDRTDPHTHDVHSKL